jgi:hypothetical protein
MEWVVNATLRSLYPPGKTRYSLYRRLGGPQGWFGQLRKISPPPGFDPRTFQPVARRYTDWAIQAHTDWTVRGSNSCRCKGIFFSQKSPDRLRVPPSLLFSRYSAQRPDREVNHSRPSSAELKNEWRGTSTSTWVRGVGRENFTFLCVCVCVCLCVCVCVCSA